MHVWYVQHILQSFDMVHVIIEAIKTSKTPPPLNFLIFEQLLRFLVEQQNIKRQIVKRQSAKRQSVKRQSVKRPTKCRTTKCQNLNCRHPNVDITTLS
jgi:hypothetical protein